jgi:hypothetical protein
VSVVIVRTSAGAQKEQDAVLQGTALPKLGRMAFINHAPVTDAADVLAISSIQEAEITHSINASDLLFNRIAKAFAKALLAAQKARHDARRSCIQECRDSQGGVGEDKSARSVVYSNTRNKSARCHDLSGA